MTLTKASVYVFGQFILEQDNQPRTRGRSQGRQALESEKKGTIFRAWRTGVARLPQCQTMTKILSARDVNVICQIVRGNAGQRDPV